MLNEEQRERLRELLEAAYPEASRRAKEQGVKPSTAMTRWLRDLVRDLFAEFEAGGDGRAAPYRHTIQLWDTSQGEATGELLHTWETRQAVGLIHALFSVASDVRHYHAVGREVIPALSPDKMRQREGGFRTMLTRGHGVAMFRIRYHHEGKYYLVTARIERVKGG